MSTPTTYPARLDEPLSRWLWLMKWFLAIPHVVVLAALLWPTMAVRMTALLDGGDFRPCRPRPHERTIVHAKAVPATRGAVTR